MSLSISPPYFVLTSSSAVRSEGCGSIFFLLGLLTLLTSFFRSSAPADNLKNGASRFSSVSGSSLTCHTVQLVASSEYVSANFDISLLQSCFSPCALTHALSRRSRI